MAKQFPTGKNSSGNKLRICARRFVHVELQVPNAADLTPIVARTHLDVRLFLGQSKADNYLLVALHLTV